VCEIISKIQIVFVYWQTESTHDEGAINNIASSSTGEFEPLHPIEMPCSAV
jgi:hypothetical protein